MFIASLHKKASYYTKVAQLLEYCDQKPKVES